MVSFGGSAGAEAQYLLAEAAFNAEQYDVCEKALFVLIEQFYPQEIWKNKGFLLLVQTYIGMEDLFQARATAQSIMENVQVPEVQEAVSDLMFDIDALEAQQAAAAPTPETNNE